MINTAKSHGRTCVSGETRNGLLAFEIEAGGSKTAFTDLSQGRCDIGFASREISPDEAVHMPNGTLIEQVIGLEHFHCLLFR